MNLLQCITKCKLFSESLAEDVARSELDSGIEAAEAGQQLEPWMEGGIQDSQVVADDIELASQASYRPLTRSERCRVRNTLYLALTLDQIRRAGDVKCIRLDQARGVLDSWHQDGCPENKTYQISVAGAKNSRFGERTIINIIPRIFVLFRLYILHVRKQFSTAGACEFLIVSDRKDEALTCSALSKAYQEPWTRYAASINVPLPQITASKNRSLNVTLHREAGATSESQARLAAHMTHSVATASRYYDKSEMIHRKRSLQVSDEMREMRRQAASDEAAAYLRVSDTNARSKRVRRIRKGDCTVSDSSVAD